MTATRRNLHSLLELVFAGPQYRASGTIRLRADATGFATVAEPVLRLDGLCLVAGDARIEVNGRSIADIAALAGVAAGAPEELYHDGSAGRPSDVVELDPDHLAAITDALWTGAQALCSLDGAGEPVLWPEHCDLAVTVDEVNYGVSPGDGFLDEPYAYVGPWQLEADPFWNAPFGAARPMRELPDVAAATAFFEQGRRVVG